MKKKAAAFIFVCSLLVVTACFGFSNAWYQSSVTVTEPLDYAKTVGAISLYAPSGIEGYNETDNSFSIDATEYTYDNIRFAITNTRDVTINGAEQSFTNEIMTDYYIRIVRSDTTAAPPVRYLAYEYDSTDPEKNAYAVDEQTGYCGPFTLPSGTMETDFRFSMQVKWQDEKRSTLGMHKMKVQMVKKRTDDSFKVIGETDLNLRADVTIYYYALGSSALLHSQRLSIEKGEKINFLDTDALHKLGMQLPDGYTFSVKEGENPDNPHLISYATSGALGWSAYYTFEITDAFADNVIEVYLVHNNKVPITFVYRDRAQPVIENGVSISKILHSEILQIEKGAEINFKNTSALSGMGIQLPSDYTYIAAHFHAIAVAPGVNYYRDSYTVPSDTDFKETTVDVYVAPSEQRVLDAVLSYVDAGTEKVIGTIQIECNNDGTILFNVENVRKLDSAFASYTSFEIGVKNTDTGATCQIGNPWKDNALQDVTANYFTIYQYADAIQYQLGYCLANPKMCLYIKAWW